MLVVAVVVVAAPFVLMVQFNPGSRADARGRRLRTKWTSHSAKQSS